MSRLPRLPREWTSFARDFLALGSGSGVLAVSRFGVFLFAARTLGPGQYGLWVVVATLAGYSSLAHLGALNGLNRDLPAARGVGNTRSADELAASAFGMTLMGAGVLVGVVAITLASRSAMRPVFSITAAGYVAALLLQRYIETWLKANERFRPLARLQALHALLLPLSVVAAMRGGVAGFTAAQAAILTVGILVAIRVLDVPAQLSGWRWSRARALIRTGFPIMLVGLTYAVFISVERWFITGWLGSDELGLYGIAISAFSIGAILPVIVADQFYPRMGRELGEGLGIAKLRRTCRDQLLVATAVGITANTLLILSMGPTVRFLLPDFEAGIGAMTFLLVGQMALPTALAWSGLMNVIDRQGAALASLAAATAVKTALLGGAVAMNLGLDGIALAAAGGLVSYAVITRLVGELVLRTVPEDGDLAYLRELRRGGGGRGPVGTRRPA